MEKNYFHKLAFISWCENKLDKLLMHQVKLNSLRISPIEYSLIAIL